MTHDPSMGELHRDGDQVVLRFVRALRHPPAVVWRAITESEHLVHWLPCDIVGERRAGAEIELPFWPAHVERYGLDGAAPTGRIEAWDPPRLFEWTWDGDRLRWELEPHGEGTRLTFTTWLAAGTDGASRTAAGYHVCFDNLVGLLDGRDVPRLVDVDVAPWEERYARAFTAP